MVRVYIQTEKTQEYDIMTFIHFPGNMLESLPFVIS